MALRTIRIQGDPVLTKKCREITEMTPKIKELIDDMLDTMYEANGVGLAGTTGRCFKKNRSHRYRGRPGCYDQSGDSGKVRRADRG